MNFKIPSLPLSPVKNGKYVFFFLQLDGVRIIKRNQVHTRLYLSTRRYVGQLFCVRVI